MLLFDQFILGKVVAKFPIPVITGIGHHKNETIVDLMAHTATKTPTKAAEFIVARNRYFEEGILSAQQIIVIRSQQALAQNAQLLASLNGQLTGHVKNTLAVQSGQLFLIHQNIRHRTQMLLYEAQAALGQISCKISSQPGTALARRSYELNCSVSSFSLHLKGYFAGRRDGWIDTRTCAV